MGEVVSAVAEGLKAIVDDVSKLVTDVTATVNAIQTGIDTFGGITAGNQALMLAGNPELIRGLANVGVPTYTAAVGDDRLQSSIKDYISAAEGAADKTFQAQFPGADQKGLDSGVVKGFSVGGSNMSTMKQQMSQDFLNWQVNCSGSAVDQMASTIKKQVDAKGGATAASHGRYSVNINYTICFAVAFGIFPVTTDAMGLVYGFSAGVDTGW